MNHIKAPDFPTGGIIYGYEGFVKLSKLVEVELLCALKLALKKSMVENV
jgi:hypothetical protein